MSKNTLSEPQPDSASYIYWAVGWGCVIVYTSKKQSENPKTMPRQHLIGCQCVKMFILKDP